MFLNFPYISYYYFLYKKKKLKLRYNLLIKCSKLNNLNYVRLFNLNVIFIIKKKEKEHDDIGLSCGYPI